MSKDKQNNPIDEKKVGKEQDKIILQNNEIPELSQEKRINRRTARIMAMEILFSIYFTKYPLPLSLEMFQHIADEDTPRSPLSAFSIKLVSEALKNLKKIDEELKKIIKNWKPERLSIVDRTLLRLGAAEIFHFSDIPPKVTINEYIEISKYYSEDDAPGFINGILDRIARNAEKL